ncbi:polysaccharide pyruvyl transferase CsaB [Paenibacillus sp. JX-17]|uniref:Polysaccharide pyruvyl transferase CsaB n=1 Tax=Paenibacillus lacisoli TaxID=3064525 RepID=A0ABT9CBA3_9BACL|nr:polysaccharide pyruvyl transferase CsaB [Paenibacillus sp. JX-17]MDO7906540.1 polysaccharide pyruvyl transferase CsaB [Paenibacillus sp. JX-17]
MDASTQTLVISGYYGFRNSGDEAVLKSILTALQEQGEAAGVHIEPVVLSIDPEWTTSMYGVKSVHRMKLGEVRQALKDSDGLISGGGSLLQDVTGAKTIPYYLGILKLAQWLRKPTFIYSQGIGPVNRKLFNPMIRSVFRKSAYISVRDSQSAELLAKMGLDPAVIQVVPDPVMGLPLPAADRQSPVDRIFSDGELPVVGISVRYWDSQKRELDAIADGLRQLAGQKPVHLRLLPFHQPDDSEASRYVMDRIGDITGTGSQVSIVEDAVDPQQMLLEVSRCSVIIGMRLHSLIYGVSQYVPPVGISYDPKIDQFLKRIHTEPVGSTAALSGERLAAETQRLIEQRESWHASHEAAITALKQEAQAPARHIIDYLIRKG